MPRPAIKDGLSKHARYRAAKKAAGLKEVRMWAFDTENPAFQKRLQQEIALINADPDEIEVMSFIEAVADWPADDE